MKKGFILQVCAALFFISFFANDRCICKEKIDWNLEDAYRISTEKREKVCLNGIWRIFLWEDIKFEADEKGERIPKLSLLNKTKSTELRVPGEWYTDYWANLTVHECFMAPQKSPIPHEHLCNEVILNGKSLKVYSYALYEREFKLPDTWKSIDSFLRFDQFNLEGWVFINSKYVGYQVGKRSRDIPLPAEVKPGENVKLQVVVSAFVTGTEERFAGAEMVSVVKKQSLSRGIIGDVWLVRRPGKQFIKDVFVITSVRKKLLILRVEFSDIEPAGLLNGKINSSGKKDKVKEFTLNIEKGNKIKGRIFEYSIPWKDPVYWSPENPYLYELNLTWNSRQEKVVDTYLPVRFGFRELWFEGIDYYLNGYPYRFRLRPIYSAHPNEESAEEYIRRNKELGFNCIELQCTANDRFPPVHFLNKTDEMGMLVMVVVPAANSLRYEWNDEKVRENFRKDLSACVKAIRNNPSIVHWSMNYNLLGHPFDLSPYHEATDYLPPDGLIGLGIKRRVQKGSEEMLRELDDSRPILQHAGGNHGDISTSNMYLNFPPIQEKEEWPLFWRSKGIKPFIAIELGMPYEATYFHALVGHGVDIQPWYSEMLYAEYSAMYLGPKSYSMVSFDRLKPIIESKVIPASMDGSDLYEVMKTHFWKEVRPRPFKNYIECQTFIGDFIKSWRAFGVCGFDPYENIENRCYYEWKVADSFASYDSFKTPGIKTILNYKPKYTRKTILWDKYKEIMGPELFYIGGKKDEFTDKQHSFRSREKITKSVIWVNDTLQYKNAKLRFEVKDNKKNSVFRKDLNVNAKPGKIKFNDVSFKAPEVRQKTSYTVYLTKEENGKDILKDKFNIQVFPEEDDDTVKAERLIWLVDKKGLTRETLRELEVPFKDYKGENLGKGDLLIIGRESITELSSIADEIKNAAKNGLNMIVFEQQKEDLENYCRFRAFEASSRRAFLCQQSHPVYKGISAEDMVDWTGKGTLLEEYPKPTVDENPKHIWKFGNRGIVSSVVIEKPHRGGFIPILHQGFDMTYTPLLEEKIGKGRVLYCQLDVTGREEDSPVIEMLTRNLIEYMGKKSKADEVKVVYAGAEHGKNIMDLTGIDYGIAKDWENLSKDSILVLGDAGVMNNPEKTKGYFLGANSLESLFVKYQKNLTKHMKEGGYVVLLAVKNPKKLAGILNVDIGEYEMEGYWFDHKKVGELTMGLSAGDLYWKDNMKIPLPDKKFPISEFKVGKGKIIVCQVDPLYFPDSKMNQRRYRSRYKFNGILSVIFSNLGASSKKSSLDYLKGKEIVDIDLTGEWKFRIDIDDKGLEKGWYKEEWKKEYKNMMVPGSWEAQGENTPNPNVDGKEPYDGYAWYQRSVVIPSSDKEIQLYSEMGTVDDYDWTYFNGELIGNIGKETPNYWAARRFYAIPPKLIHYDKPNIITVRVFDGWQEGGILKKPVRITHKKEGVFLYLDSSIDEDLRFDPYSFHRW